MIWFLQINDGIKQQKLQRDQELMNRLTGIWEEKWSKAQKMIQVSCHSHLYGDLYLIVD